MNRREREKSATRLSLKEKQNESGVFSMFARFASLAPCVNDRGIFQNSTNLKEEYRKLFEYDTAN